MSSKSIRHSMAALVAAFFCTTTAFAQDNQGTPEQRAACVSDAFRFCSHSIPDAARVETCLRQRATDLSDECRSVFEQSAARQKYISDSRRFRD
jgi:hypothetical protein